LMVPCGWYVSTRGASPRVDRGDARATETKSREMAIRIMVVRLSQLTLPSNILLGLLAVYPGVLLCPGY